MENGKAEKLCVGQEIRVEIR